jgi:ABC-2 type transport system permease protein
MRGLMEGRTPGIDVVWTLVRSAAVVVVPGPITMKLYQRK